MVLSIQLWRVSLFQVQMISWRLFWVLFHLHLIHGEPFASVHCSQLFFVKELYLFANEGENHTNNVKQLEEMKKGTEDTRADSLTAWKLTCGQLTSNQPSNQ